ncbi:short-chain dehydrogenase, partial [Micractinium conductrix]
MQDREDQAHKGSRSTLNGKYDMVDDGPKLAINAWRWARDGFPHFFLNAKEELGLKQDRKPPESLTWGYLSSFHTALSHKYKAARQTANPDIAILKEPLLQFESYRDSYDAARRYLTGGKGHVNLEGADPQAGTHADTYEYADFVAVIRLLVRSGKLVDAREASEFAMMHFSIGRSDDIRLFHLCHLVAPILIKCIGPVPFFVMAAMLTGGKTQQVHESFVLSEMQSVVHAFRKGGARQADESG